MEAELREEIASLHNRIATLHREEASRIEDVRKKSVLRVFIRLTNYLHIHVPRLFLTTELTSHSKAFQIAPTPLVISFDGITDRFDALACPRCKAPTYKLLALNSTTLGCPSCPAPTAVKR